MSFGLTQGGGSGYSGLVRERQKARKSAPALTGLEQWSPRQIDQSINGLYGRPLTDTQIGSAAKGMLDPVVAALTSNINARAKTASDAIAANSSGLAKALAEVDYAGAYKGAKSEQAAVDEALRASLAGEGGRLSADLQTRLAGIEDPAVAAAGGNVAATGAAAGNTELARGSASLSQLIAAAAAAAGYGAKQPGIARLSGLQDIAGVQRDASQQLADQTGQVTAQLPSIVQALRNERSNLRGNRASLFATLTGQNTTRGTAAAGLGVDQAKLNAAASKAAADERYRRDALATKTRIAEVNATLRAEGIRLDQAKQQSALDQAVAKGRQPSPSLSRAYGYIVDAHGQPVLDASGKRIPVAKTKTATSPFDVAPTMPGG